MDKRRSINVILELHYNKKIPAVSKDQFRSLLSSTRCFNFHMYKLVEAVFYNKSESPLYGVYDPSEDKIYLILDAFGLKPGKNTVTPQIRRDICTVLKHEYIHRECFRHPKLFLKFKDYLTKFYETFWGSVITNKDIARKIAYANFNIARMLDFTLSTLSTSERKSSISIYREFAYVIKKNAKQYFISKDVYESVVTTLESYNGIYYVSNRLESLQKYLKDSYTETFGSNPSGALTLFYGQELVYASEILSNTALINSSTAKKITNYIIKLS